MDALSSGQRYCSNPYGTQTQIYDKETIHSDTMALPLPLDFDDELYNIDEINIPTFEQKHKDTHGVEKMPEKCILSILTPCENVTNNKSQSTVLSTQLNSQLRLDMTVKNLVILGAPKKEPKQ
jgi:hypothetical protein